MKESLASLKSRQPRSQKVTLPVIAFDFLISLFLGIWLAGGFYWGGHLYLRHGADPRRAAVLVGLIGYLFIPGLRERSPLLRGVISIANRLRRPRFRWGVYVAACFLAIILGIVQTLALRVTLYDVGIFHQILWSLTHGLGFHSTISGAGNFLQDHFAPSLILLAPLFSLFSSPFFLPIVQPLCLFGGGAAWIYLASRVPRTSSEFRSQLSAATTAFFIFFDSVWGNLKWGFHENAIFFVAFSWSLAFLFDENSKKIPKYVKKAAALLLLIIAAGSKEILLLDIAFALGVWAIFETFPPRAIFVGGIPKRILSRRKSIEFHALRKKFYGSSNPVLAIGLGITAMVCVAIFIYFEKMVHPADKNYFNRYYSYLGQNLSEFIHSLLFSPWIVFTNVGGVQLFKYVMTVGLPWLFLPWISWERRSLWLLAILPSFLSAALATYPPLRGSDFHYVLELWPVLAVLTLLALARYQSTKMLWVWVLLALLKLDHDPLGDLREYWKESQSQSISAVRKKILELPESVSIAADELAGTWVAGREWVTRWPSRSLLPGEYPQYILLGSSDNENKNWNRVGKNSFILEWKIENWSLYKNSLK